MCPDSVVSVLCMIVRTKYRRNSCTNITYIVARRYRHYQNISMGSSHSRPFSCLSKEEISFAVADLGERYKVYCESVIANGVDGSFLIALDESEIEETLDDLDITNRLHRRVLIRELNKAQSSNDFVSASYDYDPSTPASELEPYSQIAETCFQENRKSAVMAGVHLILNNGNQLSLDTKVLKNGQLQSKRLTIRGRHSICSTVVNDGRDLDYYKIQIPLVLKQRVFENQSAMTYTGFVLKDESGKRVGVVCMVDRCSPTEVADSDRKVFLGRMARETEKELMVRSQLLEKRRNLEPDINGCQNGIVMPTNECKNIVPSPTTHYSTTDGNEIVISSDRINTSKIVTHPIEMLDRFLFKQVSHRLEKGGSFNSSSVLNDSPSLTQTSETPGHRGSPVFQDMANEEECAHLSENFYELVDQVSTPRPPIPKNDMERSAAVGALNMTDIGPDDKIALHLKSMVKMAKHVFGFPHGEITFLDHEHQYRIAGHGESDEVINALNTFFQPIQCNSDGSRFLCKMPRGFAVCNYVIASGQTFVVQDLAADERFRWLANMSPLRSYVGTPIKDQSGQIVAILCLFDTKPRPDFETAHEIQIEQFASLVSQRIENWALTRSIEQLVHERQVITQTRNKTGPPKGKVTFVLTDIQGSTNLWESDPMTMQQSQDIHDNIIRQLCAAHWGYEIETEGDSFTLAFHDPVDAFGFALNAQLALFEANCPESLQFHPEAKEEAGAFRGLRVRMAIHHGAVECLGDETFDRRIYKGETLNLTKSLVSMAKGGQILSTAETIEVAYFFMGSVLGYPQVLDHGRHVMQKGRTLRQGLVTKRIIQLVPAKLAFDYFTARKLAPAAAIKTRDGCNFDGRQFPSLVSLKAVSASFHDAPFKSNEATIAFVNLADIDEQDVLFVSTLIGRLLDGSPQFRGYQCQSEMMVFHCPVDAVLFGLHLKKELGKKAGGADLGKLIKYGCIHDTFLTMGPHRSTGRADYFGKIVNRAARLTSVATPGAVYFGIVCSNEEKDERDFDPINDPNVKVSCLGRKILKSIQEEISIYECESSVVAIESNAGKDISISKVLCTEQ